jgi:hypothetical protein
MIDSKTQVWLWLEFMTQVRMAMILDVMHEFMTSEQLPHDGWLFERWQECVERNQKGLEAIIEILRLEDKDQPAAWKLKLKHDEDREP